MKLLFLFLGLLGLAAVGGAQMEGSSMPKDMAPAIIDDYRNLPLLTITGDTTNLRAYEGQVVMLVNVASKCGNTPQYAGLEQLYRKYKDQGFAIIGFPANNFKSQEPGTDAEILSFCQTNYGVTFPLMSKISVKGEDQHLLYAYLTGHSPFPGPITWNFNKFLLNRDGEVVARWDQKTKPEDPALVAKIEELLAQPK